MALVWRDGLVRRTGAVGSVLQPDVTLCEGLMHLHAFGIMARTAGVLVTPHRRGDLLGTVVSLHCAASLQKTMFFGFPQPPFPASTYQQTLKALLVFKDGMVYMPQGPGLGVELQEWIFGEVRA